MRLSTKEMRTSTTTSLFPIKRGIVEAWTGVMRAKPIVLMASRIHSAKGGVRASHALGSFFGDSFGGIMSYIYGSLTFLQKLSFPRSKFVPEFSYLIVLSRDCGRGRSAGQHIKVPINSISTAQHDGRIIRERKSFHT